MGRKMGFTHESTHNESKEWYTPKYIFDAMGLEFDLDPCSPGKDVVPWIPARKHLTIRENGLAADWNGLVFVNPPYGSDTIHWLKKLSEHGNGIALVFSRTDTNWFHQYAVKADVILFIKRRVQFIPAAQVGSYLRGLPVRNSGSGSGSMLLGYGPTAYAALMECELGTPFIYGESGDNDYNLGEAQ